MDCLESDKYQKTCNKCILLLLPHATTRWLIESYLSLRLSFFPDSQSLMVLSPSAHKLVLSAVIEGLGSILKTIPIPKSDLHCWVYANTGYQSKSICVIPNMTSKCWLIRARRVLVTYHETFGWWRVPSAKVTATLWTNCELMFMMTWIY